MNLSASPYHAGKGAERERMLAQRARDNLAAVLFCNTVGGQDELVFDGHSVAIDQDGEIVARAPQFEEALTLCTVDPGRRGRGSAARPAPPHGGDARARLGSPDTRCRSPRCRRPGRARARSAARWPRCSPPRRRSTPRCARGCATTCDKNGFERVVFGLSGGIDSALVALLAVDALGPERVTCVSMPSPYSSEGTQRRRRARSPRTSGSS